jgi:Fe-S-cluster-containing dehydrogenase component
MPVATAVMVSMIPNPNPPGGIMPQPLSKNRRALLKGVLTGTISATVLMVYRPGRALVDGSAQATENIGARLHGHDYAYVVQIHHCIGCGNCVRGCARENDVPIGQFRTWVERYLRTTKGKLHIDAPNGAKDGFQPLDTAVRNQANKSWFTPKLCNHCRNAPCVQVCPVGATFSAPGGFVLVDPEHCIACGYCVQGCPYSARFINKHKKIADKCTWCYHRIVQGKLPACVTVCPKQARLFGDLTDPKSAVSQVFQGENWLVLKPAMHTTPYCFYVGLPREVV